MDREVASICEVFAEKSWVCHHKGFFVVSEHQEDLMPDEDEKDGYYSVLFVRRESDGKAYKAYVRCTDQGLYTCVALEDV